ncbi:MAG: hypothetical protein K6T30_09750, partial [Alicyclobacillus sp.]|nr:hypothetical protein [Alicyclobacillus sp.]
MNHDWLSSLWAHLHSLSVQTPNLHEVFAAPVLARLWFGVSAASSASLLGTVVWAILQMRRRLAAEQERADVGRLLSAIQRRQPLEENLKHMLSALAQVIRAPYYALYLWDVAAERYVLRAVSHPYDLFEGVGPAYSGLALPKREAYLPPPVVEVPQTRADVSLRLDGEVPMLMVRLGSEVGLVRIGPVQKLPKAARRRVHALREVMTPVLDDLVAWEREQVELDMRRVSEAAIRRLGRVGVHPGAMVEVVLEAAVGVMGCLGGWFLEREADGLR